MEETSKYAPDFPGEEWSERDRFFLEPFATNLDGHVHVLRNLPPEIVGALCSRASRAADSLLRVLLKEYFYPILDGESKELAQELEDTVKFMRDRGFKNILNNQRAQAFYAKWLSQYGDDSIAQMTGTHVVFPKISQVAMKYVEDQRIGLEPIEKSTRYVNFGNKIGGSYLYYTPKTDLGRLGLLEEYRRTLDHLFDTYVALLPELMNFLKTNYAEKDSILEKKAFDTLRGLLPMATLGQVAFRGNAQAWEYLINRMARHPLGEFRWIAQAVKVELDNEIPSLLLRVLDQKSEEYQEYLGGRGVRGRALMKDKKQAWGSDTIRVESKPTVKLVEYDKEGTERVLAGILFPLLHKSWDECFELAKKLSNQEKKDVLGVFLNHRKARWHKMPRAFENSYLRFEIVMNAGAYRDLHRHRMMTQERQLFSTHHGYDTPQEIKDAHLTDRFTEALEQTKNIFEKIEQRNPELAQYVVPLAYRMRFYQWKNFRQVFWEAELRTISQGHPDYRYIEHEIYRLVKEKFPLIAESMLVDLNDYPIARRGTEEKIEAKEKELVEKLRNRNL